MIFVTFGVQLPFDRLVSVCLEMANLNIDEQYLIQGNYSPQSPLPNNVKFIGKMNEIEFEDVLKKSDLVISHAGMGTLITCLKHHKKVIMIPRDANRNEHRNNHQMDTLNTYQSLPSVYPCIDTALLQNVINEAKTSSFNEIDSTQKERDNLARFFEEVLV